MNITAVVHYYLPTHRAGAEVMLHELLCPLAARGHRVQVWATDQDGPDTVVDGVHVHCGRPNTLDATVVVSHLKNVPLARDLARAARARFVQVLHSDAPWIAREVRRGADLFVANTHWVADALSLRARRLVVRPPVWPADHATTPGDRVTLVNPLPEKGAGVFYELAARLPGVRFLAVEGGYQQPEQTRPSGQPNIAWQPHTTDMRRTVWSRTKVLLMPSSYESYGMCAVEAAASGIPTIAAPTPGLREALGDAGLWADPDDVDLWEKHLRDLLDGGWGAASAAALARSRELDSTGEVAEWVRTVETSLS
ncbi:glycosyltransferase family 4 protein [Streptomyces mutabilis]|uniref:glycosyltransferase family 4 protein n=1 Tax=Streptomyces mutabilis TaxID=67332 RepID=UPI00177DD3CC|nr:glycosyltransferase family 4 protein [Streptomyces mutabilis]GGQ38574.1 hypothetical protein GCM10010279_54880 [Streptomyces mutabilis]